MTTLTTGNAVAPRLKDLTVPPPPPGPADWNDEGVVVLHDFIGGDLIDAYRRCWERENRCEGFDIDHGDPAILHAVRPGGWPDCTPYMRHPEILDLLAPLAPVVERLLGEPAAVHLNLTGWVSTERDWHQDSYLNPPHVGDHYAAVWVALGDVHPDSGPFQYVPGSHRWPQVTRELIGRHVDLAHPAWPKHSEAVLSPLFAAELEARGVQPITYLPERGDVLVWHGRLLHRGSVARVPGAFRPGFIAHLSGLTHRVDMPAAVEHSGGGWFFPLDGGPV